jgi:hypothetical protein
LIFSAFSAIWCHQFSLEAMAPSVAPRDYDFMVDFGRPKNKKTSKSLEFRGFDFV